MFNFAFPDMISRKYVVHNQMMYTLMKYTIFIVLNYDETLYVHYIIINLILILTFQDQITIVVFVQWKFHHLLFEN